MIHDASNLISRRYKRLTYHITESVTWQIYRIISGLHVHCKTQGQILINCYFVDLFAWLAMYVGIRRYVKIYMYDIIYINILPCTYIHPMHIRYIILSSVLGYMQLNIN